MGDFLGATTAFQIPRNLTPVGDWDGSEINALLALLRTLF